MPEKANSDATEAGGGYRESGSALLVKAAAGLFTGIAGSVAGKALVFMLQVLISRAYGPSYYGLFVTGLLTVNILQTLSHLGIQKGGMRALAIAHESQDGYAMQGIFRFSLLIPFCCSLLVGAAGYCLAPFIAVTFFSNPELEEVLRLFSLSIPFLALLRIASDLTRAFKTARYAVLAEDLLFPASNIALFMLLHALGYGFYSVIYAYVLASAICSLFILIVGLNLVRSFASGHCADPTLASGTRYPKRWKEVMVFSLPLFPMGLLFNLNGSVDLIMLNAFTSSADVGEYGAAARWAMLFGLITLPMKLIFAPMIAGQYGINDVPKIEVLYKTSSRWMLFMTLPVFTFLLVARDPLMMIFGKGFTTSGPDVLAVLLMGAFFASLVGVAADLLIMSGNQYRELGCLIGALTLNVSLSLLLIPKFGVMGAAVATAVSSIAADTGRIIIVAARYGMHPFSRKFWPPIAMAFAVFAGDLILRWLIPIHPTLRALLAVFAVVAVVVGIMARGLAPADRELFSMLRQRLGNTA
jgi:O-antigen/teichoic acid export membrane protein